MLYMCNIWAKAAKPMKVVPLFMLPFRLCRFGGFALCFRGPFYERNGTERNLPPTPPVVRLRGPKYVGFCDGNVGQLRQIWVSRRGLLSANLHNRFFLLIEILLLILRGISLGSRIIYTTCLFCWLIGGLIIGTVIGEVT